MRTELKATTIVPIIGDPVAQVATPAIWNAHFEAVGRDLRCVPMHVLPAALPSFVAWVRQAGNVPGFVSTIPHKPALPPLCDEQDGDVSFLGIANTVRKLPDGRLECASFDGQGMLDAIEAAGISIRGASLAICGAGAAGGAVALEAQRRGVRSIRIRDIDADTAERLARRLRDLPGASDVTVAPAENGSILVNASPLGSGRSGELAFPRELVATAPAVADAVTDPAETPLIRTAREEGRPAIPGHEMSLRQAPLMWSFMGLT